MKNNQFSTADPSIGRQVIKLIVQPTNTIENSGNVHQCFDRAYEREDRLVLERDNTDLPMHDDNHNNGTVRVMGSDPTTSMDSPGKLWCASWCVSLVRRSSFCGWCTGHWSGIARSVYWKAGRWSGLSVVGRWADRTHCHCRSSAAVAMVSTKTVRLKWRPRSGHCDQRLPRPGASFARSGGGHETRVNRLKNERHGRIWKLGRQARA